jgi:hypothetical protein
VAFVYSLFFDAFSYEYNSIQTVSSVSVFCMGTIAILGGGFLEWFIWLANPLWLISAFLLLVDKRVATKIAFAGTILSLLFVAMGSVLAAESGTRGKIVSLGAGYCLWVLSLSILTVGCYLYFRNYTDDRVGDDHYDSGQY